MRTLLLLALLCLATSAPMSQLAPVGRGSPSMSVVGVVTIRQRVTECAESAGTCATFGGVTLRDVRCPVWHRPCSLAATW